MSGKPMPLPPGSRKAQDLEGYEKLSLEELERAMLDEDEDPIAKAKAEAEAKAAEEAEDDGLDEKPDDKDESGEEDEEEKATSDEEDEETDEESEEKEDEPSPLEKKIAALERQIKIEALERAKESEARKRAELLASRQAGRAGFLEQKLQQSPSKAQAKPEADEDEDAFADGDEAKQTRQEQNQPVYAPTQWDEDRAELVKIAVNDESNSFAREHAKEFEEMPDEFIKRLQELIQEEAAPYAEDFKSSSVKTVRKLARSCMNSAYATARIEFADKVAENAQAEAETRKAESVSKSKRRKAKAAISKGGSGPTKKPSKAKSYEDMDDDELEAAFLEEFGDDYRIGSAKSTRGGL